VRVDVHESADAEARVVRSVQATFETLYREHFEVIYAYVLRRCGSADAPDLVADVFATAWRRLADVPPAPESKLWLYGVARRVVSQHYRARTRRERLKVKAGHNITVTSEDGPEELSDLEVEVLTLIERMKSDDRDLVTLIVWDGLTHAEVASILGYSTNAVGIRWHRALKRLRRDLGAAPADAARPSNRPVVQPLTEES
jgi:RNA polymerase sigma-70 factor (ECF subfamily)